MARLGCKPQAAVCWLLAASQLLWVMGCQDSISGRGSPHASTISGVLSTQDAASDLESFGKHGFCLVITALTRVEHGQVAHGGQRGRVLFSHDTALDFESLKGQGFRLSVSTLVGVQPGEVAHSRQRIRVRLPQRLTANLECLHI